MPGRASAARGSAAVLVADGLGHGAARGGGRRARPSRVFAPRRERSARPRSSSASTPALRRTRGAAVAVADSTRGRGERPLRRASATSRARSVAAGDGPARHGVAHRHRRACRLGEVQEFTYPWPPSALLVMHSRRRSRPTGTSPPIPGWPRGIPALVAGVLYRDFARGRDDATVRGRSGRTRERVDDPPARSRSRSAASTTSSLARQRARQIAGAARASTRRDQTRIATAVSEIARNAFAVRGRRPGRVLGRRRRRPPALVIRVRDEGPGIADLRGDPRRPLRLAAPGWASASPARRRLMDRFEIETAPGRGTTVTLAQAPARGRARSAGRTLRADRGGAGAARAARAARRAAAQNQELLRALDELRATASASSSQLNRELEDTNRGVVALYAELDEKADYLRRASRAEDAVPLEHEPRVPHAAEHRSWRSRGSCSTGATGRSTAEQEKQVGFIRKAAEGLLELVNDLLDLAKVEAGQDRRPHRARSSVADLFGALRGHAAAAARDDRGGARLRGAGRDCPPLDTDEGKVSQILRNFISNALKFTERGEVRVSARGADRRHASSSRVADTGIGIAPEDQERIFEEFAQVERTVQRRVKGTGLGLPLSRQLAELLGGRVARPERAGGRGPPSRSRSRWRTRGATEIAIVPEVHARIPESDAPSRSSSSRTTPRRSSSTRST